MRMLKISVIVMGVLIVAVTAIVVVTVIKRMSGAEVSAPAAIAHKPYDTRVALPAGAKLVESDVADGRLILRLALPDGTGAILVIDPETGRRIGRINIK